jgi:WD40 repeat protein
MTLCGSTSAAVSPNGDLFAISYPPNHFDIYRMDADKPLFKLVDNTKPQTSYKYLYIPMLFVHEGFALLTGSPDGEAKIWDTTTGYLHHSLPVEGMKSTAYVIKATTLITLHPADGKIMALSAYYKLDKFDERLDEFIIALGVSNRRPRSAVVIFKPVMYGMSRLSCHVVTH